MSSDQCQDLWDEFRKATIEWTAAAGATQAFVVMAPLSEGQEMPSIPLARYEEMSAAFRREEMAHKRFMDAYRAWDECLRKSST